MTDNVIQPTNHSHLPTKVTALLLGGIVAITVILFGLALLALLYLPGLKPHALTVLAWTILAQTVIVILFIHIVLRRKQIRWNDIGLRRPTWRLLHLLWQIPVMFIILIISQLIAAALFHASPSSSGGNGINDIVRLVSPVSAAAVFVAVGILTPIWEEIIFRGVIYGGLRQKFGIVVSVLLSAAIFALAHGVPILLPYFITAGVLLALLYEFHKTLVASMIAHCAINSLVTAIAIVSVSSM